MSKNISITAVLVALLLLVTALFGAFAMTYARVQNSALVYQAYARGLEAQTLLITRNRAVFLAMVTDAREYSKKSPAMAALLQQYTASFQQLGLLGRTSETGTNKPLVR